ncbi:hypothetical protein SOVF_187750 [Spinacia oleracea]|nr:hypothetical protein SOVF_187750 [Spinacia oleracea]
MVLEDGQLNSKPATQQLENSHCCFSKKLYSVVRNKDMLRTIVNQALLICHNFFTTNKAPAGQIMGTVVSPGMAATLELRNPGVTVKGN